MKRTFDFSLAVFGLILLSPIFVILAVKIANNLGKPVIFKQKRVGFRNEFFTLYKFRTMTSDTTKSGELLPDSERLTAFGKKLRATSLDELPSLINVIRGDMSLVGPRPLLTEYLPLYTKEQIRRHDVSPGITGWAQINGRNNITWEEKFELDVWYVENRNLWLDLKIIFLTVSTVLKKEGIHSEGQVTVPKFGGNKQQ